MTEEELRDKINRLPVTDLKYMIRSLWTELYTAWVWVEENGVSGYRHRTVPDQPINGADFVDYATGLLNAVGLPPPTEEADFRHG